MNEELQKLEEVSRASPAYKPAIELLEQREQREQLERRLQEIDRALDALIVVGQLARIDRLRHSLLASSKLFPLAG